MTRKGKLFNIEPAVKIFSAVCSSASALQVYKFMCSFQDIPPANRLEDGAIQEKSKVRIIG